MIPGWISPRLPRTHPGGLFPGQLQHLYRIARIKGRDVAVLADGVHVPIAPFMGVMAVASPDGVFVVSTPNGPPPATGVQSSGPPGPFGGNFDHKDLKAGTSLYLPVFQYGAQFFTGDGHSVQGDGELSGGALEHSLTGVFRFILHKGKTIQWPRAENDTHYIIMGIDHDFQRAMRIATLEVVKFLGRKKGSRTMRRRFPLPALPLTCAPAKWSTARSWRRRIFRRARSSKRRQGGDVVRIDGASQTPISWLVAFRGRRCTGTILRTWRALMTPL